MDDVFNDELFDGVQSSRRCWIIGVRRGPRRTGRISSDVKKCWVLDRDDAHYLTRMVIFGNHVNEGDHHYSTAGWAIARAVRDARQLGIDMWRIAMLDETLRPLVTLEFVLSTAGEVALEAFALAYSDDGGGNDVERLTADAMEIVAWYSGTTGGCIPEYIVAYGEMRGEDAVEVLDEEMEQLVEITVEDMEERLETFLGSVREMLLGDSTGSGTGSLEGQAGDDLGSE
jgi:hypothetical protein